MEKKIKNLLLGFSMMVSFAGIAAMVFYARKGEMAAIIDVAKKFLIKFLEENQGSIIFWTVIALGSAYVISLLWQMLTIKEEGEIEKYPV